MMRFKYFEMSEFDSPDAINSGEKMSLKFVRLLDLARGLSGVPFVINSGFRTPEHNAQVGGKSDSSHLEGLAADIRCTDSRTRFHILDALLDAGFNRIGIAKTFIHVDYDESKPELVIWLYD